MLSACLTALLAAPALSVGPAAPHPPTGPEWTAPDEELEQLARALARAGADQDREKRLAVLAALVALGNSGAVAVIEAEFAVASRRFREAAAALRRDRYTLERRVVQLEEMKARAEADSTLRGRVPELSQDVTELEARIVKLMRAIEVEGEARQDLGDGIVRLFETFGAHKQKKLEDSIWDAAEEDEDLRSRLGAIELLGRVGGPGTAVRLQKVLSRANGEAARLRRKLPKLMKDVREMEARMQEELERTGGFLGNDTRELYSKAKAEATELRGLVNLLGYVADACAEAGGMALAREPEGLLQKSLATLVKAQNRGKDGERTATLELLAYARTDAVRAALRALLAEEEEPGGRGVMIDGLALAGDTSIADELLTRHLLDESWHVRSRAIAACDRLRLKQAIPVLIDRLEIETGRTKTDVLVALESLTGQKLGTLPQRWREWWADNEADFQVPQLDQEVDLVALAQEGIGVSFFGIRTDSERVLFIIDTSGSMNFPMYLKSGTGQPSRTGETRLTVAKRELTKALGGIADGGVFNIVPYASDVGRYRGEDPLDMEQKARSEAIAWVDALTAVGGTNIYGVLETALDMCGAEAGDAWSEPAFDTLFFLSDGIASVGLTEDPDEILAMVRERNRNTGVVIHTIGLSSEHDVYLMRSLAEQNGGKYAAR